MANSPRPGVIQLEHPNIYQAAKQAQQDNWLRQGLKTTGDLIAKRNEDIRYNKAMGKKEDRRTSGEIAGDLSSGAWEGIKSGASEAWDFLKAPFAEEPQATTTDVQYRREEGAKSTSPIPENPEDIIERPEDVLNAPDVTTEVDGLPSTQKAAPAEKVTFPTTVVDFAQRTNFPTTVVQKPATTEQKAPAEGATAPSVASDMLQAPDYTEMFRLNPERAKFDYGRERDKLLSETRKNTSKDREWKRKAEDKEGRQEIAQRSAVLYNKLKSGELTKDSPEFIQEWGEIDNINMGLNYPLSNTSLNKMISTGVSLDKVEQTDKKQEWTEKTAKAKALTDAAKTVLDGSTEALKKAQTAGYMLGQVASLLRDGAANNSFTSINSAVKMLIQSLDNSVVMAGEWGIMQDQALLGRAKAWLETLANGKTYTKESLEAIWGTAKTIADVLNSSIDKASTKAMKSLSMEPSVARLVDDDYSGAQHYVGSMLDMYRPDANLFKDRPQFGDVKESLQQGADKANATLGGALGKGKGGTSTPTYGKATLEDLE